MISNFRSKAAIAAWTTSAFLVVLFSQAFSIPTAQSSTNTIFVDSFGAVGNGVANDKSAVLTAFSKIGDLGPTLLVFGVNKSYYLKRSNLTTNADILLKLEGKQNVTIDGQGSTLLLDLHDSAFLLTQNKNITIKNLKVAYTSPNFTQGTITQVSSSYFVMTIDAGYPWPNPAIAAYANSALFDSAGNFLRDSEIFIEKTEACPSKTVTCPANSLLVYPTSDTVADLSRIRSGNRIAFGILQKKGRVFELAHNSNVTINNVEIHGSMGGSILANENEGEIVFDSIQIKRQPKTNRLIVTLADGFHIFDNRGRVTIKNSFIERILDDGINIGSMAEVATAQDGSNRVFQLRSLALGNQSPELRKGDTVSAYNVSDTGTKYFLGSAKIINDPATGFVRVRSVTLDRAIAGVVLSDPGDNSGGQNFTDQKATRFFIDQISNPNFIVLNNRIVDKQRNGILARGPHGLVRRNTINNIGGSGIFAANTLKFNEGPMPVDIEISGNSISGVGDNGVVMAFNSYGSMPNQSVLSQAQIVNNILDQTDLSSIKVVNAFDVNISGNVLPSPEQTSFDNLSAISNNPISSLFTISGSSAIYFSAQLGYCKYKSMNHLTGIWGEGYVSYLSVVGSVPNGLKFQGDCGPNEGVHMVGSNLIQRVNKEGVACRFGSMDNLLMITGFTHGNDLKSYSLDPSGTSDAVQICSH